MGNNLQDRIAAVVLEHGRLGGTIDALQGDADLYELGLSSHASVGVMLALEAALGIEFPERMLRRELFASVANICRAVEELTTTAATVDR
jgi:acyl carrier protein